MDSPDIDWGRGELRAVPPAGHILIMTEESDASKPGFRIPAWALSAIATAALTLAATALTLWKNDTVRENQMEGVIKVVDLLVAQQNQTRGDVDRMTGKVLHLEKDQAHFQELAIDKIDTLLERDRFRKNR